uniref:L-fucose mutarotase n=2 Tax=Lepeophtheirus salmonis TaxID=72036 RepID=D3PJD1_LEPSM|nr:Protein fucU homolog [Lepeophtheirus salmonis]
MSRLRGIPSIISPELIYTLARMGHGDEIVFADSNFPSFSTCKSGPELIDASGHPIPELLKAILPLFPLDCHVFNPAIVMGLVNSDKKKGIQVEIWNKYVDILESFETDRSITLLEIERFEFYERSKRAFAVVATSETALYGNIILKKGVIS